MNQLKKWKLLSSIDASPSPWFPIENRTYQRPDGEVVKDFFVTTLSDSVHIVPITTDGNVVMIKMYKQGIDDIMIQFAAGRMENKHSSIEDVAVKELEEETGIRVTESELIKAGELALMTTKASEKAHIFAVKNVTFNSKQKLDDNEEIEVLQLTPHEIDEYIATGKIWDAPCIAAWQLVKSTLKELWE